MDSIDSSAFSLTSGGSGSMDSYVSDQTTEDTSAEGAGDNKWRDIIHDHQDQGDDQMHGKKVGSPRRMTADEDDQGGPPRDPRRNQAGQENARSPAREGNIPQRDQLDSNLGRHKSTPPHTEKLSVSTSAGAAKSAASSSSPTRSTDDETQDDVQILDSPVEVDDEDGPVTTFDSPIEDDSAAGEAQHDEVQMVESPVDEVEEAPAAAKIKGRPRPRPGG